ncbi:MAG: hypothetical protein IK083_08425 [Abditibacteriota bacterium]|nr:hypothetical protein [Abditibacteriota bacterium]
MCQTNLYYFRLSVKNKESYINPVYSKLVNQLVIPQTSDEKNALTEANEKVIRNITTIYTLIYDSGYTINDDPVYACIKNISESMNTEGMNFSAFCQYFNVHNINYNCFQDMDENDRVDALKYIIQEFIKNRHKMYESHGYSNIVMQVMCDSYSHKRKGSYGTQKIAAILDKLGVKNKSNSTDTPTNFYLLSDKEGKDEFKRYAEKLNIPLSTEGRTTKKFPDAFIKIGNDYYVVEQKNMKESGGGQDKQMKEVIDFIDKKPTRSNIHYVSFLDGIFFNLLSSADSGKLFDEKKDIQRSLKKYKGNYFVNTFGFHSLFEDLL